LTMQRSGWSSDPRSSPSQWRKRRAPLRVPQYEVKCDCATVKITKARLLRNGSVKAVGAGDIQAERVLHPFGFLRRQPGQI
jgi:hypothetical protein